MNGVKELSPLCTQVHEHFIAQDDPAYLVAARLVAMAAYEAAELPWYERSDLSRRNLQAFAIAGAEPSERWRAFAEPFIRGSEDQVLLVVADGRVVWTKGLEQAQSQGLIFTSLREAARSHADVVQQHLGRVVPFAENKLTALNGALWRNGVFVYIPSHVKFDQPLQFVSVTTVGGQGTFVRNLIIAEPGAEATFLESYLADPAISDELHVGVTEVVVNDDAHVKIGSIHDSPKTFTNVLVRRANVQRGGQMDWVIGEMADGYTVAEYGSHLAGEGSRSTSHAVALGAGRAHLDLTSSMLHIGRFSESDTSARGVMKDRANAIIRGLTHIVKGASGANGEQSERLLMLSPKSRADAIPKLLIDENDVKCGHAASVGQINEDQLFYLMSRGVSEAEAKRMIVWGFIDPVLAKLPVDIVRTAVEKVLERKMA